MTPKVLDKKSVDYVELHAASAFSFLEGASLPEDLIAQAARLGLSSLALVDTNGLYGAPRFYKAAREAGIRPLVGAEVTLSDTSTPPVPAQSGSIASLTRPRLTLLVASRSGYQNLCMLLTAGALARKKGETAVTWEQVASHAEGLYCLTGGEEGPLIASFLKENPIESCRGVLNRLSDLFPGRVYVELQRHRRRDQEARNVVLIALARALRLPTIATNGVRYARPQDKELYDLFTCIRNHTSLDAAIGMLGINRERHLKAAGDMRRLFADLPEALSATSQLSERLNFTLADLGYRFPDYPLAPGETAISYLRKITWEGARVRFRPISPAAHAQLEKELGVIEKLNLAGYFLIVWDIVQFCKNEKILVQGRGSAANSAVCYALCITAVDPVKMELLFERFLSQERGEWPDIDLDLPSGDQRERVIQYLYRKYGAQSAAMTANVITYRPRSSIREAAKAFGCSAEQVDRLAGALGNLSSEEILKNPKLIASQVTACGLDPAAARTMKMMELWIRMQNLPRHLGQHSGGMVIAAGRLDQVVPLEPASMPGRVIVQWDKDDCADLGLVKVDLLGLGMMAVLEDVVPMIQRHDGVTIDYARLPPNDPKTYAMLQAADTVGTFQVESRAQMATLPRMKPTCFYDIVVEVAIIRPGPIVGKMLNPYLLRRAKEQPVTYPHPSLEPILKRTLGIPLFQEQLIRMAMVAAGFTGGQADELRRAMGFKRSQQRMNAIEVDLRAGMNENGITGAAQEQIVQGIKSFALYGFPESHAASFALLAYASVYLKAHHPAAFLAALLNNWPMGFYHPATLVTDAGRHGVEVRPIDVTRSAWLCDLEPCDAGPVSKSFGRAVRLGFRYAKGFHEETGRRIEAARAARPFASLADFEARVEASAEELARLADIGAFGSLGGTRRQALWQVEGLGR